MEPACHLSVYLLARGSPAVLPGSPDGGGAGQPQWRMPSLGWGRVLRCGVIGHVFFLSLNCKHMIRVK